MGAGGDGCGGVRGWVGAAASAPKCEVKRNLLGLATSSHSGPFLLLRLPTRFRKRSNGSSSAPQAASTFPLQLGLPPGSLGLGLTLLQRRWLWRRDHSGQQRRNVGGRAQNALDIQHKALGGRKRGATEKGVR